MSVGLQAQYDDLYITTTPADEIEVDYTETDSDELSTDYDDAEYGSYDSDSYDDYEYYSEYDNYYSSRIRRFSRPAGSRYYNSYYSNDIAYDPFYSYYRPQYYTYSRYNRGFFPSTRRAGSFISINFGRPGYFGGGYYNPFRSVYGGGYNAGFGSGYSNSGFATTGARAGRGGCPIGGFSNAVVTNQVNRASTGSRKTSSTRTSRITSNSRVKTYKSGSGSQKAPRTTSGSRKAPKSSSSSRSARKTKSTPRSNSRSSYRPSKSSSRSYKPRSSSSSRSYSPSRSSSRSSGSRSTGSSRRGR